MHLFKKTKEGKKRKIETFNLHLGIHQGQISVTKEQIGRAKKCVSFTTATIGAKRSEAEKAKL